MDDSIFLVASISVSYALNRPADWIVNTGEPYSRFDPIDYASKPRIDFCYLAPF